jgi:hypothetical protein
MLFIAAFTSSVVQIVLGIAEAKQLIAGKTVGVEWTRCRTPPKTSRKGSG